MKPLEETANIRNVTVNGEKVLDVDVRDDASGVVVSTGLLKEAVKGIEQELGGDSVTRKWLPVLYR